MSSRKKKVIGPSLAPVRGPGTDAPELVTDAPELVTDAPEVYAIAPGRSVTSRKGLLVSGDLVTADMLQGGVPAFDALLISGVIIVR